MSDINKCLGDCLYFSSNKLARVVGKMAEEEFKITGLSPTYAFLISIVNENSGISQKEIGEKLHMTPSTITRFIDKLENKGLLIRKNDGKNAFIYLTESGCSLQVEIDKAWSNLNNRYSEILGVDEVKGLTQVVNKIAVKLEEK
jgi:DNA-binding MarR family transcriptional regulator